MNLQSAILSTQDKACCAYMCQQNLMEKEIRMYLIAIMLVELDFTGFSDTAGKGIV